MTEYRCKNVVCLQSQLVVISVVEKATPPPLLSAIGVCVMVGMALIWRNINSKIKGENRTFSSLLFQYLAVKAVCWLGKRQRQKLEADTLTVKEVQEQTLLKRLHKNANTCYGKQYDFSSIHDSDVFRARHPITSYNHYQELIRRVAAGEEKVIIAKKPLILAMTSGTSGSSAMLLSTKDTNTEFFLQGVAVCLDAMQRAFPATNNLQRTTKFFYTPTFRQSENGIPIGPNSFTPASYHHMLNLYTTPAPAFNDRWQELVRDIEEGKVSSDLALEPKVRTSLEALVKPDPKRAAQLRAHFQEGFRGIARRLWPHLNLVLAVDSGSNQIYGEMLRENYCQGVPFYSPFYAATEESSLEDESPQTLLMEEVTEGHNYELVITNASGLYRYRIGDIVKVVGFHNRCPIVEFLYRRGQMLNVRGEKVSETLFLGALKKAVAQWPGAQLVDYSCAESGIMGDSIGGSDPHYQVFIELKGVRKLSEEQRYKLDICLQQDSAVYKSFRVKGSIGSVRVQLVAEGAFRELSKKMMDFSNTSPNTFKMQRVLRKKEYADFLLGKTVS
ncbi:GH3 domain-containing protein Precursor [Channa argus]|uniref:GH3 domain-containing protein n=1 Tax=Channa argus TaxID=215402 RepID=A0A6G1QPY9_CHAAH|nr:GH3 domain-containing protein Precursor [Channa argus]